MVSVVWKAGPTGAVASRQFQGPFLIAEKPLTTFSCVCNASTLTRMEASHIRKLAEVLRAFFAPSRQRPKYFYLPSVGGGRQQL